MDKAINNLIKYCCGKKIAVAVSGGMDSMALISLVLNVVKSGTLISKSDITVININHNIRAKESDRDTNYVRQFCAQNDLRFECYSVDVPALCAVSGRSTESEAREVRRGIFSRMIDTAVVKYVLTAHHALDNAESVLMHMFRGCGISGLAGMPILSENGVLRPLINTEKADIEKYVLDNNIAYVTDSTNLDCAYNRNYVRNEIMPKILSRYSGAVQAINRLSAIAANSICSADTDIFCDESGDVRVRCDSLSAHNSGERIMVAIKKLGVNSDIFSKHIDIVKQLVFKENGCRVMLANNVIAIKEYDFITFTTKPFFTKSTEGSILAQPLLCGAEVEFGDNNIKFEVVSNFKRSMVIAGDLYINANAVPSGAVLRFRQNGDCFTPFGGGTKKLKQYLIDKKIPLRQRDKLVCLCYNSTVLAILGIEISEKLKAVFGESAVKITFNSTV